MQVFLACGLFSLKWRMFAVKSTFALSYLCLKSWYCCNYFLVIRRRWQLFFFFFLFIFAMKSASLNRNRFCLAICLLRNKFCLAVFSGTTCLLGKVDLHQPFFGFVGYFPKLQPQLWFKCYFIWLLWNL